MSGLIGHRGVLLSAVAATPTAFRYFRMVAPAGSIADPQWKVGEFRIIDATGAAWPQVEMTGNTTSNPTSNTVVSANHILDDFYGPWRAFDLGKTEAHNFPYIGDSSGAWMMYLQVNLGSAGPVTAAKFGVTPAYSSESNASALKFYGSTTGAFSGEEILLASYSNITGWVGDQEREFLVN